MNFGLYEIANVLEKLPKLFRKIMCGELDFALYEIAKILDIHISRPILFIKSITCGQCQKMKFENVTFSFVPFISTSIFPIKSNVWNIIWNGLVNKLNLYFFTQVRFMAPNLLVKSLVKLFFITFEKMLLSIAIEIFDNKCIFLETWNI